MRLARWLAHQQVVLREKGSRPKATCNYSTPPLHHTSRSVLRKRDIPGVSRSTRLFRYLQRIISTTHSISVRAGSSELGRWIVSNPSARYGHGGIGSQENGTNGHRERVLN